MNTTNTTHSAEKNINIPRPVGPDSYTWQDFGSILYQFVLPQAFLTQVAHPVINAAVTKEKKYKFDPWGRARDSIKLLWPVIYERPEKAIAMGVRLRELHRQIKGVDKNGKAYHALDPEAYAWVHITGFHATVQLHELFRSPLTPTARAQVFDEWKQIGSLLGIAERYIPQTEEDYWKYYNYIIEERLEYSEAMKDLLSVKHYASWPKPPVIWFPEILWRPIAPIVGWLQIKLMIATLPENFRHKFGLKFSKFDAVLFRGAVWFIRKLYPLLPEFMQFLPTARKVMQDARQNPEAYRVKDIEILTKVDSDEVVTA